MKYKYEVILSSTGMKLYYRDFDDVANLIGYLVEGDKSHSIGLVVSREEDKDEEDR